MRGECFLSNIDHVIAKHIKRKKKILRIEDSEFCLYSNVRIKIFLIYTVINLQKEIFFEFSILEYIFFILK